MATLTLRPTSSDASELYTHWYFNSIDYADRWQYVDEEVADDTTTHYYDDTGNAGRRGSSDAWEFFKFDDANSSGNINSVTFYYRLTVTGIGTSSSYRPQVRPAIFDDTTKYETGTWTNIPYLDTWTTMSFTVTTNPKTGNSWTWDDFSGANKLWFGIAESPSSANYSKYMADISQFYVVVDYTPPVAASYIEIQGCELQGLEIS